MDIHNEEAQVNDQEKIHKKKVARSWYYTSSIYMAADSISALHGRSFQLDFDTLFDNLADSATRVNNGNTKEIEQMLMMQAKTLDYVFQNALGQLSDQQMVEHANLFANIAFKAQNQCRRTLQALAELKNPGRTTFIKQQNNAMNQQVNNEVNPGSSNSENSKKVANELLSEANHEALDYRGTPETIGINQTMETVEISRSEDS